MLHADISIGSAGSFLYATATGSATRQEESSAGGSTGAPPLVWDSAAAAERQEVTP